MNRAPGTTPARTQARRRALQAVYQWQFTGQSADLIARQFREEQDMTGVDGELFDALLAGVIAHADQLDADLAPCLDRPLDQVDLIERAVLRLGAAELRFHPDTPFRVVLAEAVDLARTFGAEQGHAFVNGVLDRLARTLRAGEAPPHERDTRS